MDLKRKWIFIHATGHKIIWATPEVADDVLNVLKDRSATVEKEIQKDVAFIDLPGMCLVDRKIWKGAVDGLSVEMPYTDFPQILRQMKQNINNPSFNGDEDPNRSYRSVYGWQHCLAMTQAQYEELYDEMILSVENVQSAVDEELDDLNVKLDKIHDLINQIPFIENVEINSKNLNFENLNQKGPIGGVWN